jgi:hypothetical protein
MSPKCCWRSWHFTASTSEPAGALSARLVANKVRAQMNLICGLVRLNSTPIARQQPHGPQLLVGGMELRLTFETLVFRLFRD